MAQPVERHTPASTPVRAGRHEAGASLHARDHPKRIALRTRPIEAAADHVALSREAALDHALEIQPRERLAELRRHGDTASPPSLRHLHHVTPDGAAHLQPESRELDVRPAEPANLAGAEAALSREPHDRLLTRRLARSQQPLEL